MLNMEPMAATAKTPLQKPSAKTEGFKGQPGPTCAAADEAHERQRRADAADAPSSSAGSCSRGNSVEAAPTRIMPSSTPEFCTPESEVDWPGVSPKTMPGEGLEDQVLRAVGQHGDEDEDGEAPRRAVRPHLGDGLREGHLAASAALAP